MINTQKTNIPFVRLIEFKGNWEHKELNEILSESKKKNPVSKPKYNYLSIAIRSQCIEHYRLFK